jgi:hypothetical protein
MIQVRATMLAADATLPPYEADVFVPWPDCPLAVAPAISFDHAKKRWRELPGWIVLHRPTGFDLGNYEWDTREDAEAALHACDPTFPAWPLANGRKGDMATIACRSKFRAVEEP